MSAGAGWNSIPLSRPDEASLKRSRPEQEPGTDTDGHGDDDTSITSRTPSPPPLDKMDVDNNLSKYDEYVRGAAREVITVETRIKSTNKGFAMLARLGWAEGQPLGISGDGRVDPIPFQIKQDSTGLGKTNQDVKMIETTVAQRRGMDSERQQKETENQRRAREDLVARKSALESEISTTLRAFYCALCDKQFKTVAQYDEHTNSYAHHHKARLKDMQANVRMKPKEDIDKRKEKERKREEKELRKIAAANGIRMVKPAPAVNLDTGISTGVPTGDTSSTTEGLESQPAAKKSGWASLASLPLPPSFPSENSPLANRNSSSSNAPAFRTAGWTSLDTGSSHAFPPPSASPIPPPPPPSSAPPLPQEGWSTSDVKPAQGGWAAVSGSFPPPAPSTVAPPSLPPPDSQPVRSSWQHFQKLAPKKR